MNLSKMLVYPTLIDTEPTVKLFAITDDVQNIKEKYLRTYLHYSCDIGRKTICCSDIFNV